MQQVAMALCWAKLSELKDGTKIKMTGIASFAIFFKLIKNNYKNILPKFIQMAKIGFKR